MEAALWDARAKWFELGLALDLSEETLEVIYLAMCSTIKIIIKARRHKIRFFFGEQIERRKIRNPQLAPYL